jgi:hypothetical protein
MRDIGKVARAWRETAIPPGIGKERGWKLLL